MGLFVGARGSLGINFGNIANALNNFVKKNCEIFGKVARIRWETFEIRYESLASVAGYFEPFKISQLKFC